MGNNPSGFKARPIHPVEMVSWDEAVFFCQKLGERSEERAVHAHYRLPTEAEWEYACRAGTLTRYSFGDDAVILGDYAWWGKNSFRTQPAGQKKPNRWGLQDLHGNVWEWCNDLYAPDYYVRSPDEDPSGPDSGSARVLRGGSLNNHHPGILRSTFRSGDISCPGDRYDYAGFRVSRTLTP